MTELRIPPDEAKAIASVDTDELTRAIDQAIRQENSAALRPLHLESCGPYIAGELRDFEKAVAAHTQAKAARKREQTEQTLRRAGYDLSHAVAAMTRRLEEELEDAKLFVIRDRIFAPSHFSENMSVTITYEWRKSTEDDWNYGRIVFTHEAQLRTDYLAPRPKRKPSAATKERERQEKLYQEWDHLKRGALYSLQKYFKDGGDPEAIPATFKAVADRGHLNNFSTDFWREWT